MTGRRTTSAFTLVELIVVMALLALVAGVCRRLRSRARCGSAISTAEAARFLAATEYGRDEAVSQGVPMIVWIDAKTRRFGIEAKSGFIGDTTRDREFTLHSDVEFELEKAIGRNATVQPIEFAPDGAPATTNVESVILKDRFASVIAIARTTDGWSYEILKEAK